MDISNTIKPKDRSAWRGWLDKHYQTLTEIWLLFDDRSEEPTVTYRNLNKFDRRLQNFVDKTADNGTFGNWNDEGRLP